MMTPHATRDVSTLKGHAAPMKSLCATEPLAKGRGRVRGRGAGPRSELLGGWFRSRRYWGPGGGEAVE